MLLLLTIPGVSSLGFGVAFLCAPRLLRSPHAHQARWIETDAFFIQYRISASLCLIAAGLFCLSSAYYVWLRLHS